MVDVNVENLRQSDLAKLPLYAGDVKDQFTAEQWIERISHSNSNFSLHNVFHFFGTEFKLHPTNGQTIAYILVC